MKHFCGRGWMDVKDISSIYWLTIEDRKAATSPFNALLPDDVKKGIDKLREVRNKWQHGQGVKTEAQWDELRETLYSAMDVVALDPAALRRDVEDACAMEDVTEIVDKQSLEFQPHPCEVAQRVVVNA